jgi:hypothetical protein
MGKAAHCCNGTSRTNALWPCNCAFFRQNVSLAASEKTAARRRNDMTWTTPVLVEICAGLEINGYLPPEI